MIGALADGPTREAGLGSRSFLGSLPKRETLTTTRRLGLAPSGRGSRSAADVVVGTGTDDEPSLGVTRDRNGLTLQGA